MYSTCTVATVLQKNANLSEEGSSSEDLPISPWLGPRRTSGPFDTKATRALEKNGQKLALLIVVTV